MRASSRKRGLGLHKEVKDQRRLYLFRSCESGGKGSGRIPVGFSRSEAGEGFNFLGPRKAAKESARGKSTSIKQAWGGGEVSQPKKENS